LNARYIVSTQVRGEFAELGVWKGNSAAILAHIARPDGRKLFLFDTFSGFDARDFVGSDASQSVAFSDTSLLGVKQLVGDEDGTLYCVGYFPESVTAAARDSVFALAHIDCDLYEPMKAALEFFYPRLSPGGMIVMHDYSSGEWKGATKAIDEFLAQIPEQLVLVPDKSGTAIIAKSRLPPS
jgi:predicted O-methyltransferase YrrM